LTLPRQRRRLATRCTSTVSTERKLVAVVLKETT
jgi:hypothetical protein